MLSDHESNVSRPLFPLFPHSPDSRDFQRISSIFRTGRLLSPLLRTITWPTHTHTHTLAQMIPWVPRSSCTAWHPVDNRSSPPPPAKPTVGPTEMNGIDEDDESYDDDNDDDYYYYYRQRNEEKDDA